MEQTYKKLKMHSLLLLAPFFTCSCASMAIQDLEDLAPDITRVEYKIGGHRLSVLQGGPLDGKKVVFIHGIPANSLLWEDVLKKFINKGFRVYAPDLPGYGQTEINNKEEEVISSFSLEGAADLLHRWIKKENLGKVWMVSHDIGGGVGQIFASKYEEDLTHATFSNCIVSDRWPIFAIGSLKTLAHIRLYGPFAKMGIMEHGMSWSKLQSSVYDKKRMTRKIAHRVMWNDKVYSKKGRKNFANHLRNLSPSQLSKFDKNLARVSIPVLLAWAKEDPNQPWEKSGEYLKGLLNSPDILFLEKAGHFFQLEKPNEYSDLIIGWYQNN